MKKIRLIYFIVLCMIISSIPVQADEQMQSQNTVQQTKNQVTIKNELWDIWYATNDKADVEVTSGDILKISSSKNARAAVYKDNINVQENKMYKISAQLKATDVTNKVGGRISVAYILDKKYTRIYSNESVTGTTDWKDAQVIFEVPASIDKIKIELFYENTTGIVQYKDVEIKEINNPSKKGEEEFEKEIHLNLGIMRLLTREKNTKISRFEIENNDVLSMENYIILPKKEGQTNIKLFDNTNKLIETIKVTVEPKTEDIFDTMRQRWQDILIGDRFFDINSLQMLEMQTKLDQNTKDIWDSLNKNSDRTYLWDFKLTPDKSANLTKTYRNIQALATSVMNKNSKYYLNRDMLIDVLNALDWMKDKKYNSNISTYNNWWDWEIGTPRAINDTLIMLYPILKQEYINDYVTIIDRFVPDANKMRGSINPALTMKATGANQIDISKVKILQNILRKDENGLILAKDALKKTFPFVLEKEGFYHDGSFIQHDNVAYTGAYGNVLVDGLSQLLSVVQNTKYSINDEGLRNIDAWFKNSFAPIMYDGLAMDMARGRSISRETSYKASSEIVRSLIRIAEFEEDINLQNYYKQLAKSWILSNKYYDYQQSLTNYRDLYLAKKIVDDSSIIPFDKSANKLTNFAYMDKVSYKNADKKFGLAISMTSSRTKYYEAMNDENIKGWYTGQGMTYIYNDDISQYNDDFWATIDPYRLPGITVEKSQRENSDGVSTSDKNFVGGSRLDDKNGSFAMEFNDFKKTLSGRKSWFIMDEKIVALGSNIEFAPGATVETIIDNRKLNETVNYKVFVDGKEVEIKKGDDIEFKNVSSIYLFADKANQSIGYKFLSNQNIHIKYEDRQGSWKDINKGQSDKVKTRTYLTIYKKHTKQKDSYDYVIYPNVKMEELLNDNSITILRNDEYIHAVDNKRKTTGINVFENINYELKDIQISSPISMTIGQENSNINFAIADPSMNTESTLLKIKAKNYQLISSEDASVTQEQDMFNIRTVDKGKGFRGQSAYVNFSIKKEEQGKNSSNGGTSGNKKSDSKNSDRESHRDKISNNNNNKNTKKITNKPTNTIKLPKDIINHPAKEAIENALQKGYFVGTSKDTFSPNKQITRGQLITVLGRMKQITKSDYKLQFKDVKQSSYYAPYLAWAVKEGIVSGYEDNTFRASSNITKQEMCVIVARFLKLSGKKAKTNIHFKDEITISPWALESVKLMRELRIVDEEANFRPYEYLTRAQTAQILMNIENLESK